jgi:hypothetical protein
MKELELEEEEGAPPILRVNYTREPAGFRQEKTVRFTSGTGRFTETSKYRYSFRVGTGPVLVPPGTSRTLPILHS